VAESIFVEMKAPGKKPRLLQRKKSKTASGFRFSSLYFGF